MSLRYDELRHKFVVVKGQKGQQRENKLSKREALCLVNLYIQTSFLYSKIVTNRPSTTWKVLFNSTKIWILPLINETIEPRKMYIFCQLSFKCGPSPFKGAHQKQPAHQRNLNVSIWTWTASLEIRLCTNCLFDNILTLLCSNKGRGCLGEASLLSIISHSLAEPLTRKSFY